MACAPGRDGSRRHSRATCCGTRTVPATLRRVRRCPTRARAIRGPASATTRLAKRVKLFSQLFGGVSNRRNPGSAKLLKKRLDREAGQPGGFAQAERFLFIELDGERRPDALG